MWQQAYGWLRTSSWASYFHRLLGLCLLMGLVAKLSGQTGSGTAIMSFILLAIGTKEAVEFDLNGGRAWQCWRETRSVWRTAAGYVPPEIKGWAAVAGRILMAAWRPPVAPPLAPPTRLHTYIKRSSYTMLLPMLMLSSVVEIPLVHGIIHISSQLTPTGKLTGHLLVVAAHVLAFWVLWGDSRWLRADQGHHSSESGFHIRLGARAHGDLAWDDVRDVAPWRPSKTPRSNPRGPQVVSPLDGPNVRLRLKPDLAGHWERRGERQPWPSEVYLYVDDATALITEVEWRIGRG